MKIATRTSSFLALNLVWFFVGCLPEKISTLEVPLSIGEHYELLGDPHSVEYAKQNPWASFKPEPFSYKNDADAFLVGGVNCSAKLKNIKTITGASMEDLNARCHANPEVTSISALDPKFKAPKAWEGVGNISLRVSGPGFLSPGQSFFEILQKDNEWVLSQRYTHQKIAEPLLLALASFEKYRQGKGKPQFKMGEREYWVQGKLMAGQGSLQLLRAVKGSKTKTEFRSGWVGVGTQGSPFNDEIFADYIVEVFDAQKNRVLVFDAMTPHLIYRYGFYQGGPYRLEPQKVIQAFGLTPSSENPCSSKT